ncbi:MAG: hypothetical protein E7522_07180 [Ruminococcaceae bacterium]|nr:hypothetical protein [Oscillospiraceae bacterium]
MSEFISVKNKKDIKKFLEETNNLHDSYIISVQYTNNGIDIIDGGYSFSKDLTELKIVFLVTSVYDKKVEVVFNNIREYQIVDKQFDITDTSISFSDDGFVIWVSDYSTEPEIRDGNSYVIAENMKWKMID